MSDEQPPPDVDADEPLVCDRSVDWLRAYGFDAVEHGDESDDVDASQHEQPERSGGDSS